MKKSTLIILGILVVGIVMCGAGFAAGGMRAVQVSSDGVRLLSEGEAGEMVKVSEEYDSVESIAIDMSVIGEVVIVEGDGFSVEGQNYRDAGGIKTKLSGGTLTISESEPNAFKVGFVNIGVNYRDETFVMVTVPSGTELSSVVSDTDVSDISISGISAKTLDISANTGDLTVSDCVLEALDVETNVGDILIMNVEADFVTVESNTGDFDALNVSVTEGFDAETDVGSITLENCVLEGKSIISSHVGDIDIVLDMDDDDMNYELEANVGDVIVDGFNEGKSARGEADSGSMGNSLSADSDVGSVNLTFAG